MTSARDDMLDVVKQAINAHPRSLQKRVGPSGIGTPCARKLWHRLNQTPPAAVQAPAWRATVGTATHTWLTAAFQADNERLGNDWRWVVDLEVSIGDINGQEITGHLDLYDVHERRVVDWKVPGPTSIKDKRRHGPGDEYRVQVHAYGTGAVRLGLPVETVGILFLPSNGELADSHYWEEPYDPWISANALRRAEIIQGATGLFGEDAPAYMTTAPDHCGHCDWFSPGATDLKTSCPGDPAMTAKTSDPFPDLLSRFHSSTSQPSPTLGAAK